MKTKQGETTDSKPEHNKQSIFGAKKMVKLGME